MLLLLLLPLVAHATDYTTLSTGTLQTLSHSLLNTSPLEALAVLDVLFDREDAEKRDVVCRRARVKERVNAPSAVQAWKDCAHFGGSTACSTPPH
ncbi:hypothetical protein BT69DRAFT_811582 [Atractiella rhizophila]|nr:hypothetical protein BT69DRAFT_811582 [Atractiella rhizophila]